MPYIPDKIEATKIQTAKTDSAKLNSKNSVSNSKTTTTKGQYSQSASNIEQVNLNNTFSSNRTNKTSVDYPTYHGETTLVGIGMDKNGNTVVVDKNYGQGPPPALDLYHTVKEGDTLSQIAKDNNVSLEELLEANKDLKEHPDEIDIGDKIKIPTSLQNSSHQANTNKTPNSEENSPIEYAVKSGDTLSQIAKDNGMSVEELAKFNHIENPDYIEIGQIIQIPSTVETVDLNALMTNYEVNQGDTLSEIALKYGIDYHYLAEINHIENPDYIETGQKIIIPNKEAINQFFKEKLDNAIENIKNKEDILDILNTIFNTKDLVTNSNVDNNQELITDLTIKYQKIIHEALENGTLQKNAMALIGTITTVISVLKNYAEKQKLESEIQPETNFIETNEDELDIEPEIEAETEAEIDEMSQINEEVIDENVDTVPETEPETETPINEMSQISNEVVFENIDTETETESQMETKTQMNENETTMTEIQTEPQATISPYQDLMERISPSETKEIDFSEIIPGSPVALAIEKYGEELINAKYAVVTKDIFIVVNDETIEGNSHYVTHIIINDPSQIKGEYANGAYMTGEETPSSAANRIDSRVLINGSHFIYGTGEQDMYNNAATNNNDIVIFNGEQQKSVNDYAGGWEICLDKNGKLFNAAPGTSVQQLLDEGVLYTFTSHDAHLINNGSQYYEGNDSSYLSNIIGMVKPGEYYILTGISSNYAESDYLYQKGCTFAKSMDQGGSVELIVKINGKQTRITTPTDENGERPVGDFLAFF